MIGSYLQKILTNNHINKEDIGVLILFFALPFTRSFVNITIAAIILYSVFHHVKEKKWPAIQFHWFLPLLFCYFLISVLITGGSWSLVERRLTLIIIPIIFALNLNYFHPKLKNKIYTSFIAGNILASIFCTIRALVRSINIDHGKIIFDAKVLKDTDYDFLTSSVMGGNYFFSSEFSYFLDSTYFALYIVFAQFLIFELFRDRSDKIRNRILVACYIFLFIPLFLLSSKAALISSSVVLIFGFVKIEISLRNKVVYLLGCCTVILLFFLFNPRLQVFLETITDTAFVIDPLARYGHSLRILSWDASIEIIKDNWLIGVGEGNKEAKLLEMYLAKGYDEPAKEMYNSHNLFLDFLLGGGLIGLGVFLAGLSSLVVRSFRQHDFVLMAFVFVFSFAALFENLLTRFSGNLLFAIFITLLLGIQSKVEIVNKQTPI
jgi:O-antigen ligase